MLARVTALCRQIARLYPLLFVIVVWQAAANLGWVRPIFLPSFSSVVLKAWALAGSGELWPPLFVSLYRAGAGLAFEIPLGEDQTPAKPASAGHHLGRECGQQRERNGNAQSAHERRQGSGPDDTPEQGERRGAHRLCGPDLSDRHGQRPAIGRNDQGKRTTECNK